MISTDDPPNLSVGPIQLWTISRLPGPTADPWWGDEIICRGLINSSGARIELAGQIPSRGFGFFLSALQSVYDRQEGRAVLDGDGLGLMLSVEALSTGQMTVTAVILLAGIWEQPMRASFRIDQTELRPILGQLRQILEQFPVRADRALL